MASDFDLLVYLAEKSGLYRSLKTSTVKIAQETKASQQTVSRKLRQLDELNLISRTASAKGMEITIMPSGKGMLQQNYSKLKGIFESLAEPLSGSVCHGIGEGAYYVLKYKKLFKQHLGFTPYPGTLNLKVEKEKALAFLDGLEKVRIEGFKDKSRTFGALDCYLTRIKGIKAAVIVPERTRHEENVLEIIAPDYLRGELKLKNKDLLVIE